MGVNDAWFEHQAAAPREVQEPRQQAVRPMNVAEQATSMNPYGLAIAAVLLRLIVDCPAETLPNGRHHLRFLNGLTCKASIARRPYCYI